MEKIVLYPPQMEKLGAALAKELAVPVAVCTAQITSEPAGASSVVSWEQFPSGSSEKDPNIKVRVDELIGKHVILLMSQDDTSNSFAQLSLLLWLQGFYVPTADADAAKGKWKSTVADGKFTMHTVGALTVVIPWYRYCQMERSCRWAYTAGADKPWSNSVADGSFIDISTAHTYAALLSADPPSPPGAASEVSVPTPPPKEILFVDIHDDLNGKPLIESALSKTGKWANPTVEYDLVTGSGTYFASAFAYFLQRAFKVDDVATTFVVFPDVGAYRRFHTMVEANLRGIPASNVLYIEKKRVGTDVTQSAALYYNAADGTQSTRSELPAKSHILIPDDFTNSGSTLFGGAGIVRQHVSGDCKVGAFVTHFVAKYERAVVDAFVQKLYSEVGQSDLNNFYTTDSIPLTTNWLLEEAAKRSGGPERVQVTSLAPLMAEWIKGRAAPSAP